ncbi:hypothetical protein BGZ73_000950, partial [Actinomortierella ambigua]
MQIETIERNNLNNPINTFGTKLIDFNHLIMHSTAEHHRPSDSNTYGSGNRLRSLMDIHNFHSARTTLTECKALPASHSNLSEERTSDHAPILKHRVRTVYAKASERQLESLIEVYMNRGLSIRQAAQQVGLPTATAFRYIQKYSDDPNATLSEMLGSVHKTRKPGRQLTQEHTEFILSLIDDQATLTVE